MENELKKLVHVPSRIGRDLQRYHSGRRQVVGCIPYKLINNLSSSIDEALQVLMVSSQKGNAMLFPKGGWEKDESKQEAALRESLEEAGVIGSIQSILGQWTYKSKSGEEKLHDGYMFPLLVQEELDYWPEKDFRQRKWLKVSEAKKRCPHVWMIEALQSLVQRLTLEKKLHAIPCFPQAGPWFYYSQTPCFRQPETRVSSCNTKPISGKSQQLRRTNSTDILQSCRNSSNSYLHRVNGRSISSCETMVLFNRSNRKGLSDNFGIDTSTLSPSYLLELMVEQK